MLSSGGSLSSPGKELSSGEAGPSAEDDSSKQSIFQRYRLAFRFIQTLTRTILKPQQTLREYARENINSLGPLGKYFFEFTQLVERLLYSTHRPTPEDAANSQRLSQTIREEAPGENL